MLHSEYSEDKDVRTPSGAARSANWHTNTSTLALPSP